MSLDAGTRIGPYEVQAAIGAGGMGEVYRARDTRLNRDVAIKILPTAFALEPDRSENDLGLRVLPLAPPREPRVYAGTSFRESDG
jgi:serine/threonine protein kinase